MIIKIIFFAISVCLFCQCSNSIYKKTYREAANLSSTKEHKSINKSISKYNDAIRYILYSIEGKFEAHKAMGITLMQSEMYLAASTNFEEAKKLKPTDSNIHYYLGLSYANYSRLALQDKETYVKLAEDSYQIGLNLNNQNTIIHYSLGLLNGFIKGELENGIKHLEIAKSQEPRDLKTLFALANLYFQKGNLNKARALYENIITIAPEKSEQWQKAKDNIQKMSSQTILEGL